MEGSTSEPEGYNQASDVHFEDYKLNEALRNEIITRYRRPTKVQAAMLDKFVGRIPTNDDEVDEPLPKRNYVVQSETGSGKTLAMLIPIGQNIDISKKTIQCIIVVPTLELCDQIVSEAEMILKPTGISIQGFRKGTPEEKCSAHVIVSTPGKLSSLIRKKFIDLSHIEFFILDEADNVLAPKLTVGIAPGKRGRGGKQTGRPMLEMKEDVEEVVKQLKEVVKDPTFILFSATYPEEVKGIIKNLIGRANLIKIEDEISDEEKRERLSQMPKTITNIFVYLNDELKREAEELAKKFESLNEEERKEYGAETASSDPKKDKEERLKNKDDRDKLLLEVFAQQEIDKCIVFSSQKNECEVIAMKLTKEGYPADFSSSNLEGNDRGDKFRDFREGKEKAANVIVATDTFGRGIDIPTVTVAICYSYRTKLDDETVTQYIHRAGRTSRFGRKGKCFTLICNKEDVEIMEFIAMKQTMNVIRVTCDEILDIK